MKIQEILANHICTARIPTQSNQAINHFKYGKKQGSHVPIFIHFASYKPANAITRRPQLPNGAMSKNERLDLIL